MPKAVNSPLSDDPHKWLALAGALVAVGILPRGWQRNITAASTVLAVLALF